MKNTLIFIVAMVIAGSAGYGLQTYLADRQAYKQPVVGSHRPEFAASDLQGRLRNIGEWDGKVILLNFWATWCPPCKKEIPDFIELQKAYRDKNFQIIGIAIDEDEAVRRFADKLGINYPIMAVREEAVALSQRYGNIGGNLPYSVFIDQKGEIRATFTGELSKNKVKAILERLGVSGS